MPRELAFGTEHPQDPTRERGRTEAHRSRGSSGKEQMERRARQSSGKCERKAQGASALAHDVLVRGSKDQALLLGAHSDPDTSETHPAFLTGCHVSLRNDPHLHSSALTQGEGAHVAEETDTCL